MTLFNHNWDSAAPQAVAQDPIEADQYVVVAKNKIGGVRFIGPFNDAGDARLYALGLSDNAWVADLEYVSMTMPNEG